MSKFIPWGFIEAGRSLTATESSKDRERRHQLGEAAIATLGKLGVSLEQVGVIADEMLGGADPLEVLQRLQEKA